MGSIPLNLPSDQLAAFCHSWKIQELSLFGSVLRDDFGPESDFDFLISFADDAPWSRWGFTTMGDELATIVGHPVDLIEKEGLRNPFRRHRILQSRSVIDILEKKDDATS